MWCTLSLSWRRTGPLLLTNTGRHCSFWYIPLICWDFSSCSDSKESACNTEDPGSIPGLGRSLGEGNSIPLQYSCLENPMDRGAWQATVLGITKSRAELSDFHFISLHFIDLLSILLRCNDFTGIQKAAVDQSRSGPTVTMTFFFSFWCKFGFGKCFGASL